VLASDSPILIQGETGTGKGVLAAWLHANGPRADEPFVDLNCAGLTPQFLDTELFGHERGAFTGAVAAKAGLFELAHLGTLFLDEIGDVDAAVQPKLLKALEEQRFRRLGEVRDRVVDVRLIAASHMELAQLVAERKFRSDLYFRINTLPLRVPPLRERPEDVPALAQYLLEGIGADLGKPGLSLTERARQALQAHAWPGNVRELRNVLERAALLAGKPALDAGDLRFSPGAVQPDGDAIVSLQENERRHLERVLRHFNGRVEDAAKVLELSRSALYERLKKHGLSRS
jgi:transcriptional regulator with GAF, ATPase, and Fis domain